MEITVFLGNWLKLAGHLLWLLLMLTWIVCNVQSWWKTSKQEKLLYDNLALWTILLALEEGPAEDSEQTLKLLRDRYKTMQKRMLGKEPPTPAEEYDTSVAVHIPPVCNPYQAPKT